MDVGRSQKYMDARTGRLLQRAPRAIDVGGNGTRESGDDWPPHRAGHRAHRLVIAIGRNRESRFNDVHAQAIELLSETQLFRRGHAETGGLLAVAKRRIEDLDARDGRHEAIVSGWRH